MNRLNDADVGALLRIAGEVSELAPDGQVRRAHILDRLLELIGAVAACVSEVDQKCDGGVGWALPESILGTGGLMNDFRPLLERYLTGQIAAMDPCIPLLLGQRDRRVVTARHRDLIEQSCWHYSDHYQVVRRPTRITESLYGIVTLPRGRRLKVTFHREAGEPPFGDREARMLHLFNENLANLYLDPPSASGPALENEERIAALPTRLKPVLRRLLAGDSEKQVAQHVRLSQHTVHEYTKALYRTFNVNSRAELLAQFVVALH